MLQLGALNMEVLFPSDANELANAVGESAASARSIALSGAGSKSAMGGSPSAGEVDLRLDKLSGILEYEPHDLTIRVAAGTPWRVLMATLAEQGQMLPLDPPCAATATVGGVVASNCSGPRRRAFGTARDMVIGMTLATLDGKLVQTGGMVVKNVAGLDMQKALIGSFGTLAAIASVNFKLAPLPEASRTFLFDFDDAEEWPGARATMDSVLPFAPEAARQSSHATRGNSPARSRWKEHARRPSGTRSRSSLLNGLDRQRRVPSSVLDIRSANWVRCCNLPRARASRGRAMA